MILCTGRLEKRQPTRGADCDVEENKQAAQSLNYFYILAILIRINKTIIKHNANITTFLKKVTICLKFNHSPHSKLYFKWSQIYSKSLEFHLIRNCSLNMKANEFY